MSFGLQVIFAHVKPAFMVIPHAEYVALIVNETKAFKFKGEPPQDITTTCRI